METEKLPFGFAMAAIGSKFLPPTNTKGARIRVWSQCGTKIYPYQYGPSTNQNHYLAVLRYLKDKKLGWKDHTDELGQKMGVGILPNGDYVWTFSSL